MSTRTLFSGVTLAIHPGDRLGLIGPNGAGKSTLLRILAGLETVSEGEIKRAGDPVVSFVAQDDVFAGGLPAQEVVLQSATEGARARGVPGELEGAELVAEIALEKARFPEPLRRTEAATLSGGWRKRLSIISGLAHAGGEPDVLLLDEPTNHLDLEGLRWLEDLVVQLTTRSKAAVAYVTHDRDFLERVTTRVAELSGVYPGGLLAVEGNYSEFLRRKGEFLDGQAQQQRALANEVRKDLAWLSRRPKARATKAKGRIQESSARMDTLAELRERNGAADRGGANVEFNASGRKTKKLIVAKGVGKSFGDKHLFRGVDLQLGAGDRLGLIGPNGSGKTTLIGVLTDRLVPDAGEVVRSEPAPEVVVFSQQRTGFDPAMTLRDALSPLSETVTFRGRSMHVTAWSRRFLFQDDQLMQPVGTLSGGELARIHIARIMLQPSDVLVLDEPTNDLDIPTLEILEESLESYPDALVLVTHDRAMLDRLATQILLIDGKGGGALHAELGQALAAIESASKETCPPPAPGREKKKAKSSGNAPLRVKLSYNEQREYDRIESDIEAAEARVAEAEATMSAPSVLADHVKMTRACEVLEQAQALRVKLYARWEELEAKA